MITDPTIHKNIIKSHYCQPGMDCGEKGSSKKVNLRSRYSDVQGNWAIFEGKGNWGFEQAIWEEGFLISETGKTVLGFKF